MTEREPMTLEELRTALLVLEHDCHVSALTLGKDGLRAMCIEAQKRLHKLFPAIDALARATEPVYQIRTYDGKWLDDTRDNYLAVRECDRRILYTHPPEPARDAKDAARYRWLRERVEVKREGGFWWLAEMEGGFPCTEDFTGNLDTEIDAAMAQESGDE
jgi:hypothetical protein